MYDVGVYVAKKFTAYMYPTSIVVCTNYQCFRISYDNYQSYIRLYELKLALFGGKIKDVVDIADHCKPYLKWENCSRP